MTSKDITLLNKVFDRLAMAVSDESFSKSLAALLPAVLKILTSSANGAEAAAVRAKVLSICSHINKRAKANEKIGLPLKALVELCIDATANDFTLNFAFMYAEMGWSRSTEAVQMEVRFCHANC